MHEPEAKEWLRISRPDLKLQSPNILPPAETPKKHGSNARDNSEVETPFTKAKKRKKEATEATDHNSAKAIRDQTAITDPFYVPTVPETPHKTAKAATLPTPTTRFAEKLRIKDNPLDDASLGFMPATEQAEGPPRTLGASLMPNGDIHADEPSLGEMSSLAAVVLNLIQSDKIELKPSTKIQIRHEIDLVVDVGRAKVQRYEETICMLHERIEELEKMVLHLTD